MKANLILTLGKGVVWAGLCLRKITLESNIENERKRVKLQSCSRELRVEASRIPLGLGGEGSSRGKGRCALDHTGVTRKEGPTAHTTQVMGTSASDRAAPLQGKWVHLFSGPGEKQHIYC